MGIIMRAHRIFYNVDYENEDMRDMVFPHNHYYKDGQNLVNTENFHGKEMVTIHSC